MSSTMDYRPRGKVYKIPRLPRWLTTPSNNKSLLHSSSCLPIFTMTDRYYVRELIFNELIESFRRSAHSLDRAFNTLRRYSEARQVNAPQSSRSRRSSRTNANVDEVSQAINSVFASLQSIERHIRYAQAFVVAEAENGHPGPDMNNIPTDSNGDSSLHTTNLSPRMLGSQGSVHCCICRVEMPLGTMVALLPCSHFMHRLCILQWLEHTNACPICRRRVMRIE